MNDESSDEAIQISKPVLQDNIDDPNKSRKQKRLLLLIMSAALVLIFIGIISTQSLFSNQHTFRDTASLSCLECHDDIWQELNSDPGMPHYQKSCIDCHQHPSVYKNGSEHLAGAKVECQSCHPSGRTETVPNPGTMGFNYSENEAHWLLYNTSEQNPLMGGANEACVSCHTNYDISITFTRPDFYEFIIDYGTGTLDGGKFSETPDRLVAEGLADVTNFIDADNIFWRDSNSDSDWDFGEDIFRDDGDSIYDSGDTILYTGENGQDSYGSSVEFFGNEQEIFYLDSDHDGAYDYTSGTEEPLIFTGGDGWSISNDEKLNNTQEALKPKIGVSWVTDAIKFSGTNYYFLDNGTGTPGTYDWGEPIILDDGNGIIEAGILNGVDSAEKIITSGYPELKTFVNSDYVVFYDKNSNNLWEDGEDIIFDTDNDDQFDVYGSIFDRSLYIGSSLDASHGNSLLGMTGNLRYIDSDHSGNYTLGEPIVNSTDSILDSSDELLYREDDTYDNGTKIFGLWDFDQNPFTSEFFIDNNNNGVYDNGEAIFRETFRIYGNTSSGFEESIGNITNSTKASGLHVYRNGSRIWDTGTGKSLCGDINLGCHRDISNAINDNNGGGHFTNSTLGGHLEDSNCAYCHRNSAQIDPDNDHYDIVTGGWHSAKRITCAFEGTCHDTLFAGGLMEEVFIEINKYDNQLQGDFCWSCHRGDFDWTDPTGKTFRLYVEDDKAYQKVDINAQTVYAPTNYGGCICHNDTISSVPEVPAGSGKFVDHSTSSPDFYDQCPKCHADTADPHDDAHVINMNWTTWEADYGSISSDFCATTCHYSVNDARPFYRDTNITRMAIEYSNWLSNGGKHALSTILGGDGSNPGSVSCTEFCHTSHDYLPSCTDSGCHLDNDALTNLRDIPDSHDSVTPGTIDADRFPCARTGCHGGGGHNPIPPGCHSTGGYGCAPNTNAHPVHTVPSNKSYSFDCTECHYDSVTGYNNGRGTFGGSKHNNGVVNIGFDITANGTATYGGILTGSNLPAYAGSGFSCTQTYCHSNGNISDLSPPGGGFETYKTPGWNSSKSLICGDCHGVPNYNNGTAWREMGGTVTKNTATHFKHTRNFAGINGTRYLFWVDATGNPSDTTPPFGWMDSIFNPGEAIIGDLNNNRMLDYGVLNGGNNQAASTPQSPDKVFVAGKADLTDFVAADNVWFWDSNTNGDWDRDEDLYVETGGGGNAADEYNPSKGDYLIYQGVSVNISADDNANTVSYTSAGNGNKRVMYLDSDHDDVYDNWYNSGLSEYSGVEEPLILAATDKATGADLESTDEVLRNTVMYLYYYTDFNNWYSFDCSECHYDSSTNLGGLSSGNGTYGGSLHVNMQKNVSFDTTANGIASKLGTYSTQAGASGAWNPSDKTCYGIWCHSDGYERDDTDRTPTGNGLPDWSGTGTYDDTSNYDYHTVKPKWTDRTRTTVYCGSCHYGWDKPTDIANGNDKPNTGAHRKNAQHTGASQFGWHSDNDATLCQECHWRYDTYGTSGENQWWRPYGSNKHVDGNVWIWPSTTAKASGQFGPLSESQAYSGGCHNTWPGNWQSGYANSC